MNHNSDEILESVFDMENTLTSLLKQVMEIKDKLSKKIFQNHDELEDYLIHKYNT
jgi:regulator of replication initiation timing